MGNSKRKSRKGRKHPGHLPKVGTPANLEWRHRTRFNQVFGSSLWRVATIVAVILALLGLAFSFR